MTMMHLWIAFVAIGWGALYGSSLVKIRLMTSMAHGEGIGTNYPWFLMSNFDKLKQSLGKIPKTCNSWPNSVQFPWHLCETWNFRIGQLWRGLCCWDVLRCAEGRCPFQRRWHPWLAHSPGCQRHASESWQVIWVHRIPQHRSES